MDPMHLRQPGYGRVPEERPDAARRIPSAHVDTFARDHLPPAGPVAATSVFDLPELRYPDRLNCAAELLDRTAAARPGPPGVPYRRRRGVDVRRAARPASTGSRTS